MSDKLEIDNNVDEFGEQNVREMSEKDLSNEIATENEDIINEESEDGSLLIIKERQKTFEKISRTMERNNLKWKRLHEYVELLDIKDDSDTQLINDRINEVKSMCWSLIRPEYILDSLKPEVKEFALSLIPISRKEFEETNREQWRKIDIFKFAVRMAHTYSSLCKSHLKYPWWEESQKGNVAKPSSQSNRTSKYSINQSLRLSLTTHPKYRHEASIQQILWFTKAIGTFSDLFPAEMENELARYISYEIYDEDRVIINQGDVPQKLYYILSGKIEMVKVYRLSQGAVHKSMGFISHKEMSDFDCFETGSPSPTYMVARSRLEVITLHRHDYITLSNQTNIDTIRNFLLQIGIFKDLAITPSVLQSQLVKIQYFKQKKLITSNSLKATYLYIVKSGKVSVARQQTILNESLNNLLMSSDVLSLGCKRDGKHASSMLGLQYRQRHFKQIQNDSKRFNEIKKNPNGKVILVKPHTIIETFVDESDDDILRSPDPVVRSRTLFDKKTSRNILDNDDQYRFKEISSGVKGKRDEERQSYVKLDTLKPLDIFGLESLEDRSEVLISKLILISEGAEILMVNKRYFLESVDNNTLLEIRKLVKSYISEDEAKLIIDEDKKWKEYKYVLMKKMISKHCC